MKKIILILNVSFILLTNNFAYSEKKIKNILILHSYHQGFKWTDGINNSIKEYFNNNYTGNQYEFSIEYMDTKRNDPQKLFLPLLNTYQKKYSKRKIDVIITSDDNAYHFILKYRKLIFPNTPVVFCGVNKFSKQPLRKRKNITGVIEDYDLYNTIKVALKLLPQTKNIAVINDNTPSAKLHMDKLKKSIPLFSDKNFIMLTNMTVKQLQNKLKNLPKRTIILQLSLYRTKDNKTFTVNEGATFISNNSKRPVFSAWDSLLGTGIVGGMLVSSIHQGEAAAIKAIEILTGTPVNKIKVQLHSPNRFIFDYNMLRKYKINLSKLPVNNIIINKPVTIYSKYKIIIWSITIATLIQSILIIVLFINVYYKKKAKSEVKRLKKQMDFILGETKTGLDIIDSNYNIVYIDSKWEKNYGSPKGKKCYEYYANRDSVCLDCGVQTALTLKESVVTEKLLPKENNRAIQVISVPFKDEKGNWLVAEVNVDISERKIAEEALRTSEENLRIMLNSIGDAVVATDTSGIITSMNPAAEKLSGYKFNQSFGKFIHKTFKIIDVNTGTKIENLTKKILLSKESYSSTSHNLLISKNNKKRFITNTGSPIKNRNNEIVGAVHVFRDITEKHKIEEKLKHRSKMDALGLLAGGIAHDFNNMLTGIMGYAELLITQLGAKFNDENLASYAEIIYRTTINASNLTQKLLSFSRNASTVTRILDTHQLIKESVNLLKHSLDRRINIRIQLDSKSSYINGDPSQIENIILNLALNAKDAMPEGGEILISTQNIELDKKYCENSSFNLEPGNYVQISVLDTGLGMSTEIQKHIFEPFFTTKKKGKGTGLGLSAVYGAVKEHHGAITVHSIKKIGTTFKLFFPVEQNILVKNKKEAKKIKATTGTVLIIDDEEIIRNYLQTVLEKSGYQVLLANDGLEGLESYKMNQDSIDIVLLDMIMPKMNGENCFYEIKKVNKDSKIIIMSGFTDDTNIDELKKEGLLDFVNKPFKKDEIIEKISKRLTSTNKLKEKSKVTI